MRNYLAELERENPVAAGGSQLASTEEPAPASSSPSEAGAEKISRTDPDAAWSSKHGPAEFAYYANYLIDNASCIILDVETTPARLSQEIVAARQMLSRVPQRFGLQPQSLGADQSYGTGEFLAWLVAQQMEPHIPVLDRRHQTGGYYTQQQFTFLAEQKAYRCPAGQLLAYAGQSRRTQGYIYRAKPSQCHDCAHKSRCTSASYRKLTVHWHEETRQKVRDLVSTSGYQRSWRARKKVEVMFSELKQQVGLRQLRLRRLRHVAEQALLAATAQNIKRLVRFLGP